jgi:hypothetical protein
MLKMSDFAVSYAIDIALIHNLTAKYALAMDETRMEDWRVCWCPEELDPCFENPAGKFIGKDEFDRLIPVLTQRIAGKRHFMTNVAVDVLDGTTATQTCYMLILPKSGVPSILGTAIYRDELIKVNGEWKFKTRKIEFDPLTIN